MIYREFQCDFNPTPGITNCPRPSVTTGFGQFEVGSCSGGPTVGEMVMSPIPMTHTVAPATGSPLRLVTTPRTSGRCRHSQIDRGWRVTRRQRDFTHPSRSPVGSGNEKFHTPVFEQRRWKRWYRKRIPAISVGLNFRYYAITGTTLSAIAVLREAITRANATGRPASSRTTPRKHSNWSVLNRDCSRRVGGGWQSCANSGVCGGSDSRNAATPVTTPASA